MLADLPSNLKGRRTCAGEDADDIAGRLELRLIFPSDPIAVRTALSSTMSGLDYLRLKDEDRSTVELVLAEAMNNVVEHAYADAPGLVELRIANEPDGLFCEVLDDGAPMPAGSPPPGLLGEDTDILDDLPEGGFGWFLIRELTVDLAYTHSDGRNQLSFRVALDRTVARN